MIRTQVLTTYLMHFFRVWVSIRPPPLFFKRKKTQKRMNKQSRLFPILKPLNTKFGKSRTNARTWHPTGTHWVTAIQPLKSTDYIFYLGLHDFCWHLLCMLALHTQTHIALINFNSVKSNKSDTNDKKALLTIEKYITIVQVKD